ncbi:hypothetical protein CHS0354_038735 [Potamilus streckersoni]|uniref:THD domain-containing protein n=1 Tax=Potamilus streckersoni TaxID=2493646 RepID=A0AAE0SF50_9BIVA|nr:hypothetical protein CHS0354_038735 [Potamilus streckersoni]
MNLFCVVVIDNCILSVILIVIVCFWKSSIKSLIASGQVEELRGFCLKCQDISFHPLDDLDLLDRFKRKNNGTDCCVKSSSEAKHLVHQFLERNHRISKAKAGHVIPKCSNDQNVEKPTGRVVAVDFDQTGIPIEERHLIRWLNTETGSYTNSGVKFIDGQLEITTPGYYWFNSRVTFKDTNTSFADDRFAFFHTVYRRSVEYQLREDYKLVEAGETRCKFQSGFTYRSTFIGDIAYFRKGERIIVKVSQPEMISLSPYDSFLEVHLY